MKKIILWAGLFLPFFVQAQLLDPAGLERCKQRASRVTVIRDDYDVPHIYGKTDADAVFGLMWTQCEDDMPRVERSYLEMLGREAELHGASRLASDLEMKLIQDSAEAIKDYERSPVWFRELMDAYADGINYYLHLHPGSTKVLHKFQPWYALMWTDGSVSPTSNGGVTTAELKKLYFNTEGASLITFERARTMPGAEPTGSNAFAIAPSHSVSGRSMLYINPHVPYYFRSEVHVVSEQGLNAYGAVTWGQFFVYQGFNEHCGWMHTSGYADVADLYLEKAEKAGEGYRYELDGNWKEMKKRDIPLRYRNGNKMVDTIIQTWSTHRGPVMGIRNGRLLSLRDYNRSMDALMQSFLRTKANGLADFSKVMEMRANTSNNTMFADDKGNIAYWHGNFIPRRDTSYDWSLPVEGSTSRTDWKGIHELNEIVHIINPANGWIQNCNATPFNAQGKYSLKKESFPAYMAPEGENNRQVNAVRLLSGINKISLDQMIELGHDHYLSAFEILMPSLMKAYDQLSAEDTLKSSLKDPIYFLRNWDLKSSATSVATSLAILWGIQMITQLPPPLTQEAGTDQRGRMFTIAQATPGVQLKSLQQVVDRLIKDHGTWKMPWGNLCRYQRVGTGMEDTFSDLQSSKPIAMAPSLWGSLPAVALRKPPGSKYFYGVGGNSFVAAVEFGPRLKAKTIVTGGHSNDPASVHYLDQSDGFLNGKLKEIRFYPEEVKAHAKRSYHPPY